jgi:Na+-transporting methylmalonyl-CoA/oxaloacetate decarboxylase gamma subunit
MHFRNPIHPGIMRKTFLSLLVMVFAGVSTTSAQEHPTEHPSEHEAEHPTSEKAALTKETLADAITDYVSKESNLKGGYFLFFDDQQGKPLALTLDKVHKERLAALGDGVYFACADFKATDDDMYDLDIFMKEDEHGLEVTEINLHKKNGEARYTWVEKDGIWSKKKK